MFITVEGGEGAGKSTNMAFLESRLRDAGVDLLVTREPGGTALGEDVRQVLLRPREEPMDPLAELLLIFAARAQHISEVIEPALAAGRWVLCPVEVGLERADRRGERDRIEREQATFFERVRRTYLQLAAEGSGRYRVIDAGQSLGEVEAQLADACQAL